MGAESEFDSTINAAFRESKNIPVMEQLQAIVNLVKRGEVELGAPIIMIGRTMAHRLGKEIAEHPSTVDLTPEQKMLDCPYPNCIGYLDGLWILVDHQAPTMGVSATLKGVA